MAKKPETVFKDKIRPLLESLPRTWICKTQQVSIRATPDFLLCVAGHFVALELKKDSKTEADPLQAYTLQKIDEAGGLSFLVHPENWPVVFKILKEMSVRR